MKQVLTLVLALLITSCGSTYSIVEQARAEFTYLSEEGNHWQSPQETELLKSGDCEDYAFWLRDRLISSGADPREVEVLQGSLSGVGHMVIRYNGVFYDTMGIHPVYEDFTIFYTWDPDVIDLKLLLRSQNT